MQTVSVTYAETTVIEDEEVVVAHHTVTVETSNALSIPGAAQRAAGMIIDLYNGSRLD